MGSNRSDLQMRVEQLVQKDIASAGRETPVRDIAETMFNRSVGSVVVVDDGTPVGIVTDRDLTVELLAEDGPVNLFETDVDLESITATDVMTADPLVVSVDDQLPHVLHHMDEAHARRIPVVNEEDELVGILTLDDVIVHLAGESAHVAAQLDNITSVIRSAFPK